MINQAARNLSEEVSTDSFDGPEHFTAWRRTVAGSQFGLDLVAMPQLPLRFAGAARTMPGLCFASLHGSDMRLERRQGLAEGSGDVVLLVCMSGSVIVSQRSREVSLAPGHAVLVTMSEAASVELVSSAQLDCFFCPRDTLAQLLPELDEAFMRPVPGDDSALRLLATYGNALLANTAITPDIARLTASHLRDLVVMTLGRSSGPKALSPKTLSEVGSIGAARLQAIKAVVLSGLGRHDLSISALAASQRVSARYIQTLFAFEGTTFSEFVLGQRLTWARRLLADRSHNNRTISDVAFEVGFGDLSYFNRTFRRSFGVTPSQMRAKARNWCTA